MGNSQLVRLEQANGQRKLKIELVLRTRENATLHRKKVLGTSKTGTASRAPDFVKAAKKIAPKKKLSSKKK